jgi:hypothetical protein
MVNRARVANLPGLLLVDMLASSDVGAETAKALPRFEALFDQRAGCPDDRGSRGGR